MTQGQETVEVVQADLLPCPFCGGEAKRFTLGPDDVPGNDGGDVIACTGRCGCSSHVEFGRKENLVSLWNTRIASTQPVGEVDTLREAQENHREKLIYAISMFADNITLPGNDGDAAYDLLRQAAAQIASDGQRIAALSSRPCRIKTMPTPKQDAQDVDAQREPR